MKWVKRNAHQCTSPPCPKKGNVIEFTTPQGVKSLWMVVSPEDVSFTTKATLFYATQLTSPDHSGAICPFFKGNDFRIVEATICTEN